MTAKADSEVLEDQLEDEPLEGINEVGDGESIVEVRSATKREIEFRLLPWDKEIETRMGPERWARGATLDTPRDGIMLMGLEHEATLGIGQDGKPTIARRVVGRSVDVWEADDGPHATFKVARTQAGDEVLALAEDRIIRGVSVEFSEVPGGTRIEKRGGRRVRVHQRVALSGAAMTYRPAFGDQAAVLAVRSQQEDDVATETTTDAPVIEPTESEGDRIAKAIESAFAQVEARAQAQAEVQTRMLERLTQLEETRRQDISIPAMVEAKPDLPSKGDWVKLVTRILTGERVPDVEMRTLDDILTSDNVGVVPPAYLTELIGVIDISRPFLSTTRRLPTPDSGMQMIVPTITQRPTTARQNTEKGDVDSTKTIIDTTSFNAITIAGGGDLSLQVIKRSSPSFLSLWLELLAEAYAIDAEDEAVTALLNAMGGVGNASSLDPENLALGDAFVSAFDAIRRPPDTIWLSTQAIGEFIDAKATTTNQPLYPGLSASATAAGGITGVISGLRPVHVPALDEHGAYAIVGPSSGFAWAEDGTYTLQVDVPAKAGRDVALVGILWPAPWYPAAFTAYNVAS